MKSKFMLTGGIIGTVACAFGSGMLAYSLFAIIVILAAFDAQLDVANLVLSIVSVAAMFIVIVFAYIFNIKCIAGHSKAEKFFFEKRKRVICAIIFNIIFAVLMAIGLSIYGIIVSALFVLASIFYVVHLCKEKEPKDTLPATLMGIDVAAEEEKEKARLSEALVTLENLKNSGALSEEEYESAKKNYIEKTKQ